MMMLTLEEKGNIERVEMLMNDSGTFYLIIRNNLHSRSFSPIQG